jgi:hypothetical protein
MQGSQQAIRSGQKDIAEVQLIREAIQKGESALADSQVKFTKHLEDMEADKEGEVSSDVTGKWEKATLDPTKNAAEYLNGISRDIGTEGEDARGPLRQVLGRVASLGEAVTLGASEPEEGGLEEEITASDEEMQEEIREAQAAVNQCY